MSGISKAKSSIVTIMALASVSRILSAIKDILIASKLGSGVATDIYVVAFTAATFLIGIIGEGITITLIPLLQEVEMKEGNKEKMRFFNNIIHVVLLLVLILALAGWIVAPLLIKLFAKGFGGEEFELAVRMLRIGLPIILFIGLRSIFAGFLQSGHGFKSGAKSFVYNNLVYIFFLVFFIDRFGLEGLMVASIAAVFVQVIIVYRTTRRLGYKYEFILDFKDEYLKKALILIAPIIIGISINQVNVTVDNSIASGLMTGSISVLTYANNIIGIIMGIFITSISTVMFPMLSEEYIKDNKGCYREIIDQSIEFILLIIIPAMAILLIFAEPLIRIIFQRGAFDTQATIMTSQALRYYSIGLIGMAMGLVFTRAYYSIHDTKTPMYYGAIGVIINIALDLILVRRLGYKGIAFATSISAILTAILLGIGLKRKMGSLYTNMHLDELVKISISTTVMVASMVLTYGFMEDMMVNRLYSLIGMVFSIGIGLGLYLGVNYILGVRQIKQGIFNIRQSEDCSQQSP